MCLQPWPLGADPQSRDARQQRFAHFTELAIISVQEIVDFAKQVPGFLQLGREDQIALLKASTIEVMGGLPILNKALPLLPPRNPRVEPQDSCWEHSDKPGPSSCCRCGEDTLQGDVKILNRSSEPPVSQGEKGNGLRLRKLRIGLERRALKNVMLGRLLRRAEI